MAPADGGLFYRLTQEISPSTDPPSAQNVSFPPPFLFRGARTRTHLPSLRSDLAQGATATDHVGEELRRRPARRPRPPGAHAAGLRLFLLDLTARRASRAGGNARLGPRLFCAERLIYPPFFISRGGLARACNRSVMTFLTTHTTRPRPEARTRCSSGSRHRAGPAFRRPVG